MAANLQTHCDFQTVKNRILKPLLRPVDAGAVHHHIQTLRSHYILDSSQWLSRGSTPDHGAVGRQITRPKQSTRYLSDAARNMLKLPTGRDAEFRDLAKRAANRSAPNEICAQHIAQIPLRSNRLLWHRWHHIITQDKNPYSCDPLRIHSPDPKMGI